MDGGQDVVIVGGGAIGVCCALELARAGAQVTLIEQGAELAWGCSAGNAGFICPGHSAPITSLESLELGLRNLFKPDGAFYLKVDPSLAPWLARFVAACRPDRARRGADAMRELATASLKLHASLSEEGLATTFSRRGILVAAETPEGLASLVAEGNANAQAGLRTEQLNGAEARSLEPELGASVVGGVHYPDEAHCDSAGFVEAIATAARDAGAKLQTRVEALRLLRSGGRVGGVETTRGRLRADTVVLAAGAWTSQLARDAGVFVPVVGGKGYHVELPDKPSAPRVPVLLKEARVAITPLSSRVRIGGTFELCGLDESVSPRRVAALVAGATRGMPNLSGRTRLSTWRGLRPCAPDGVPIIGASERLPNLVLATGHAHMGLALAPITGRLVREIISDEEPSHDLCAVRPDRFRPLI
jgi:D-amino-acid dehydrogenase